MKSFDVRAVTLLVIMVFSLSSGQIDVALRGQYHCSTHQTANHMLMELVAYDINGVAVRLNAIDTDKNEILQCTVSGSGTLASPYRVVSVVNRTSGQETQNSCGLRLVQLNGLLTYTWRFKAYTHAYGSTLSRKGYILTVRCPANDITNGHVETQIDQQVSSFSVRAANPSQETGENAVATNANIIYEVNIVPDGFDTNPIFQNAKGLYAFSCYSSTNSNMNVDRQLFIDANGCPVSQAALSPTSEFVPIFSGDNILTIRAQYATATVVNNKQDIYITCRVDMCTLDNDPFCINRCNAHRNGNASTSAVNTGVTLSTSITVQDRDAQSLRVLNTDNVEIVFVDVGEAFRLFSYNTPFGLGGTTDLQDAFGFYAYNCRYAFNEAMSNSVQFIGATGCPVPNTILTPASGFSHDSTLSSNLNPYTLKTGFIVAQSIQNRRVWIRCDTGKCTRPGHSYCTSRCGASEVDGFQNLGYRGLNTRLSILDVINQPAINIVVTDGDGNPVTPDNGLTAGEDLALAATITPGGTGTGGNAIPSDAKGIYLYSCYMTQVNDPGNEDLFIDENGCRVDNSPYKPSQNCRDVTAIKGVPPFQVDCGVINIPGVGNFQQTCRLGICLEEDHPACENRCAAGPLSNLNNVLQPAGLSASSPAFQSSPPEVISNERTATKSEELRNIIIAVCIVGTVVLLLVVSIGTCLIVKAQKSRAKRYDDSRSYRY